MRGCHPILVLSISLIAGSCVAEIGGGAQDEAPPTEEEEVPPDNAPGEGPEIGFQSRIVNTEGGYALLRSAPDASSETLLYVPQESLVNVLDGPVLDGPGDSHYEVRFEDETGWMHERHLQGSDQPNEQEPDDFEPGGTAFLLPWTGQVSFSVTQGHDVNSHVGKGRFAWDFNLPSGTPVRAAHDGVVRRQRGDSTVGACDADYANDANYVVLDRGDGLESLYLHLSTSAVAEGDIVARGEVIGTSGATGWACGAHLHFQIQQSPDGGGSAGWYNSSTHEYFHDTGTAYDPPYGSNPVSANSQ